MKKRDKETKAAEQAAPATWAPKPPDEVLDLSELRGTGKPNPLALRHTSTDQMRKPNMATAPVEPPRYTPVGSGAISVQVSSAGQWLDRYAKPEELKVFRAAVLARMAKDPAYQWKTLQNGRRVRADNVLAYCQNCHAWIWTNQPTGSCPVCNMSARLEHPGKLRPATAEETAAWFKRDADELKQAERRSFNFRNLGRQKEGLDPLSWAQWKTEQKQAAERWARDNAKMSEISAARRREVIE